MFISHDNNKYYCIYLEKSRIDRWKNYANHIWPILESFKHSDGPC